MLSNFTNPLRNVLSKSFMGTTAVTDGESECNVGTTENGEMQKLIQSEDNRLVLEHDAVDIKTGVDAMCTVASKKGKNSFEVFFTLSSNATYLLIPAWVIVNIINYDFIYASYRRPASLYLFISGTCVQNSA